MTYWLCVILIARGTKGLISFHLFGFFRRGAPLGIHLEKGAPAVFIGTVSSLLRLRIG